MGQDTSGYTARGDAERVYGCKEHCVGVAAVDVQGGHKRVRRPFRHKPRGVSGLFLLDYTKGFLKVCKTWVNEKKKKY